MEGNFKSTTDFLVCHEQNKLLEKEMDKRLDAKIKVEVESWTKFKSLPSGTNYVENNYPTEFNSLVKHVKFSKLFANNIAIRRQSQQRLLGGLD